MAEGGSNSSIRNGSDANFETTCIRCGKDGISEEAVKYCPGCQAYLCKGCTTHHSGLYITRSHKLLDKNTAKQGSVVAKTTKRYHEDRDSKMQCKASGDSKALCLRPNTDVKTTDMTATSSGCLNNNGNENKRLSAKKLFKVKSKKEINVKMKTDSKDSSCHITDVCQLQDGTIVIVDWENKKLKRLDIKYNIKDHYDLPASPMGVCCTGQKEIAVKLNTDNVLFISADRRLSKLREISVVGGAYLGMAFCDGELWISAGKGVNVYDTSGSVLKTINSRDLFRLGASHHMAINGETVVVTRDSDGAVCFGRDGRVKRELRDKRLVRTVGACAVGACVSNDGTLFLSGFNSNNIVMFDSEGEHLGELVANDAGLVNPVSLCFDNKRHCIIVACNWSDEVIIYDVSD